MDHRADPRLVLIASVLMAAVTITYIAHRSMNPERFHFSLSPAAILHPHS